MRAKPLILLVDDEEIFLEIASVKLETEGFVTVATRNFHDALDKAERLLPDLVLSDVFMPPGPNGLELAIQLRRNPKTRSIKIAFFTSLRDPWMELKGERKKFLAEVGEVTFFSKTDDVENLGEDISKLLKIR